MNHLRFPAFLAVSLAFALAPASVCAASAETEQNLWPVKVAQKDEAGNVVSWQGAAPFLFGKPSADGGYVTGFRPLFAHWRNTAGATTEVAVLYPIFTYRTNGDTYRWSVIQLINRSGDHAAYKNQRHPVLEYETFQLWPFWFSHDTGTPETSYRGLFPVHGSIKYRFGYDELAWTLFPLYGRAEKRGATTRAFPWPFLRRTVGTEQGYTIWPLYSHLTKPNVFDRRFFLWPLGWSNTVQPADDAPPGTPASRDVGFLPFYASQTGPGRKNVSYLWPFFGYTHNTLPTRYDETSYFWPFFVQGHGDVKTVNRFAPFYTHSVIKGREKKWVMWPVFRQKKLTEARIAQTQTQLFYFLYWSLEQRSTTNPAAAPAERTHLWPIYSSWDNGRGHRQFQFPSPFELFFQDNDRVRQMWSPLLSLYRFEQRSPGNVRNEVLWGLLSWSRTPVRREFHLGPLFSVKSETREKRVAFGNGIFGVRRAAGSGWRLFWFDFPSQADKLRASSR